MNVNDFVIALLREFLLENDDPDRRERIKQAIEWLVEQDAIRNLAERERVRAEVVREEERRRQEEERERLEKVREEKGEEEEDDDDTLPPPPPPPLDLPRPPRNVRATVVP